MGADDAVDVSKGTPESEEPTPNEVARGLAEPDETVPAPDAEERPQPPSN